jgi:hypothetical protein
MVLRGILSAITVKMLLTMLAMTIDTSLIQLVTPAMMEIGTNLHVKFDFATHGVVLAQQFQNIDIIANLQNGWTDFLQTGKAGALSIGLVMGYMIRGMTR